MECWLNKNYFALLQYLKKKIFGFEIHTYKSETLRWKREQISKTGNRLIVVFFLLLFRGQCKKNEVVVFI